MKLDSKFEQERGTVYLTGIQALVRLPMDQMRRDRRAGLNTGDVHFRLRRLAARRLRLALARVAKLLDEHHISFRARRERRPGRDVRDGQPDHRRGWEIEGRRRGRHLVRKRAGRRPLGRYFPPRQYRGHGQELRRAGAGAATITAARAPPFRIRAISVCTTSAIPFLYPGNTQEIIDYGLLAIALSRFSGAWVGLKMVTDMLRRRRHGDGRSGPAGDSDSGRLREEGGRAPADPRSR